MRHKVAATKTTPPAAKKVFLRAFLYRGLFSRIARELGLGANGRGHVRRVALGERTSARVEIALMQAVRRIERAAQKKAA